jgi:cell volume regulation protein A
MEALVFLTYLASVLLIGIICTIISRKLKIPNILLLIIVGIVLSRISYKGVPLLEFPSQFLTSIGILALVMIVFDSSSRFKLKEFDQLSLYALKLTGAFLFFNMLFLTIALIFVFGLKFNLFYILLALLFSALMSGTDPGAVLSMFGQTKNKVVKILEIESLINTPLVVLLPFIFLDLMNKIVGKSISTIQFFDQLFPFLKDFLLRLIAGIGAGVLIGIIIFKVMRKQYSGVLSPLSIITAALMTYILAENLGGNGVLAVTTLGLFFSNVYVKQKVELLEFSSIFTNALEILVFVLIGLIIDIPRTPEFLMQSFLLFVIYILIRFLSVQLSFKKEEFNFKERVFMALNVQKGIAVAVVVFALSILNIEGIDILLNLTLMFMLYSILLSTVILKLSKYFIKREIKPEKEQ